PTAVCRIDQRAVPLRPPSLRFGVCADDRIIRGMLPRPPWRAGPARYSHMTRRRPGRAADGRRQVIISVMAGDLRPFQAVAFDNPVVRITPAVIDMSRLPD